MLIQQPKQHFALEQKLPINSDDLVALKSILSKPTPCLPITLSLSAADTNF